MKSQRWFVFGCTLLSLTGLQGCKKRRPAGENAGGQGTTNGQASTTGAGGGTAETVVPQIGISGSQTGQSSVRSVPPSPASGCPAQRANAELGPGTVHNAEVNMNETWTLEGAPHRFPDGMNIKENATVTVVPCAVVLIGSDHSMNVEAGGAFIAVGDAQHPIRIGSDKNEPQPGDWDEIIFDTQARRTSRIAYATIEHGGGSTGGSVYSCLHIQSPEMDLQHVMFRACRSFGIFVDNEGRFSQSSEDITVREGVAGGADNSGSVLFNNMDAVGTLPSGTYTGNEVSEIFLSGSYNKVNHTATWRNPGVRYHVGDDIQVRIENSTAPVLTLAPGTTVAFGTHSSLFVGWDAEGGLIADGGADAMRITLTSAASDPTPSSWAGVFVGERASRTRTKFAWLNIAFAGADDSTSPPCPWNDGEDDSAINLRSELPAESIAHVKFTGQSPNTASIVRAASSSVSYTASSLGNDFAQSGSTCHQSPVQVAGACPEPARCN